MSRSNKYEKEILDSYENNEWRSVHDLEIIKSEYAKHARSTILKTRRINIRISEKDFIDIKLKSLEQGVSDQTLISSIIHKYVSGKLVEN